MFALQKFIRNRQQRNAAVIDPWRFQEENKNYRVFCGFLHVKPVVITFTVLKTFIIIWYVTSKIIQQTTSVMTLVTCFALFLIISSNAFLTIGVIIRKYTFVIPYLTICVMLILVLTLKLFIDVLTTANTKDTLEEAKLKKIFFQSLLIIVEIYSVYIVWKVFNYITDYYMEIEFCTTTKLAEARKLKDKEDEDARERRKERAELIKRQQMEPRRKPTFPQIAALMEEARTLPQKEERNLSENSSSSSDSKL
uniref:Uncharacterized protein n=1 Tax=Panagrolaimus superbus TaxID=310955 RepID=A0A914YWM8_9BILA